MYLKPKLKYENGFYNLFINNKEIKTPENALFNFKEKIFPELIFWSYSCARLLHIDLFIFGLLLRIEIHLLT